MRGIYETTYHSVEQLGSSFVVRENLRGEVICFRPDMESAKSAIAKLEKYLPDPPEADHETD